LNPKRNLPIFFQTGNSDDKFLGPNTEVPLAALDSLLMSPDLLPIMNTHINSFNLNSNYDISLNSGEIAFARYNSIPDVDDRYLKFALIEDLEHVYPNGINHPINGAKLHWEWLQQFHLE